MLMPAYSMATKFRPFKEATAAQAELDIAIVLDCSSSMLSPTYLPAPPEGLLALPLTVPPTSRWSTARAGIEAMLNTFRQSPQHERVSLTTFNNVSLLNVPLTGEYAPVETGLAVHSQVLHRGLTSLGDGINSAITMLKHEGPGTTVGFARHLAGFRWPTKLWARSSICSPQRCSQPNHDLYDQPGRGRRPTTDETTFEYRARYAHSCLSRY